MAHDRLIPTVPMPVLPSAPSSIPESQYATRDYVMEWYSRLSARIEEIAVSGISPATKTTLGGVIIGDGIDVDASGVISVSGSGFTPTEEQQKVLLSGITKEKVQQYDGYATSKQNALSAAQMSAVNSGITAEKLAGKVDKVPGKGLSTEDYTTVEKKKLDGIESGAQKNPDLSDYAKKADFDGYATNEQLNAVGKIAQGAADGASYAIGEVNKLQGTVEQKRDKADNIAAKDETQFTEWKFHCDVPEIQAALDASSVMLDYDGDNGGWVFSNLPEVEGWIDTVNVFHPSDEDISTFTAGSMYVKVHSDGTADEISITVTRKKVTYTKSGEPYVTLTGVKNIAIPKYEFVDAAITDGKVTVAPYTNAKLISNGTAFTVAVSEGDGKTRDCVLRVECGDTAPTITWPANFHPRTDAATDFACEAGKRNVYWITEYAPNEFCVAGWQETTGGNAQ